jgi:superfamily II DNA or RNA helicase
MFENEWDRLQDETIFQAKELTDEQKKYLNDIINNIINSIKSSVVVIEDKAIPVSSFRNYLLQKFYQGERLENIKWVTIEQYSRGLIAQRTLTGGIEYTFKVEHEKRDESKEAAGYFPPTQKTIEGEMKRRTTVKQKFFELEQKFVGLPQLYEHQEEALQAIAKQKRVSIQLPTGTGKTMVGIEAIKRFGTPAIVIVPTVILLHQWENELKKYGLKPSVVYAEEKKFGPVTITTYQTARMPKHLPNLRMYRVVILDEVHHLYGDVTKAILYEIMDTAEYIIGLSATVKQPGEKGYKEQKTYLPVAVEKYPVHFKGTPMEVPVTIEYISVILSKEEMEEYQNAQMTITKALRTIGPPDNWSRVASDPKNPYFLLARSALKALQDRRRVLSNNMTKMQKALEIIQSNPDSQFIVFLETIESAQTFKSILDRNGISNVLITANVRLEDRFKYFDEFSKGKIKVLLSVFALEEGVNLPDVDKAIWLATSRDTPRYMIQRLGRITRPKPGKTATLYWIYALNTVEEERIGKYGRLL